MHLMHLALQIKSIVPLISMATLESWETRLTVNYCIVMGQNSHDSPTHSDDRHRRRNYRAVWVGWSLAGMICTAVPLLVW